MRRTTAIISTNVRRKSALIARRAVHHCAPLQLRVKTPSLTPPGPVTGYALQRCYLRSTNNCCHTLSSEHTLSKDVLKSMAREGDLIEMEGLHWKAPGELMQLKISNLGSNILCRRHNSALSPLDSAAGRFFRILQEISTDIKSKSLSRKGRWFLVGGEAIELWGLKVLCGLYYSRQITNQRQSIISTHEVNVARFITALDDRQLHKPCGLYLRVNPGGTLKVEENVTTSPLCDADRNLLVGITIGMHGIEFDILMEAPGANFPLPQQPVVFHPWHLLFGNSRRQHRIVMTWQDRTSLDIDVGYTTKPAK